MNYLELVNSAIQESGVDLDDLTSSNFANPLPTKMYVRFKRWVNQAWEDIQSDQNEYEFGSGNAVVAIFPKILVSNGYRSTDPPAGSTFISAAGEVTMTVSSSETLSGSWASGTAEAYLTLSSLEGENDLILLEPYNELTPNITSSVFKFKYYGRYNLDSLVSNLQTANYETFYIQDPDGDEPKKLQFIPWAIWKDSYEFGANARGCPMYFTETPEGYIDFYPRLDKEYRLAFTYTKETTTMSTYSDSPEGLDSRYHGAIVWGAIVYYANYDKDRDLWNKANKKWYGEMQMIDRDLGPKVAFGRNYY